MFYRLRNTLARFMAGRYGNDQFGNFLFATYFILWLVGLWLRGIPALVAETVTMILVVYTLSRMLSRNIPRRQAENAWFLRWWRPCGAFLRRQWDRVRDCRRYRYRRCPGCSAYLRLPILRGRRTVTCSRCHTKFKAFFL